MLYGITNSRFGAVVRRDDCNANIYTGTNVHNDTNPYANANAYSYTNADTGTDANNSAANTPIQCACLYKLAAEDGVAVV